MIEHVGVSVAEQDGRFYLRILLRPKHLEHLKKPKHLIIRGQAANGFIIAPDQNDGYKPLPSGGSAFYLQSTITHFDLSARARKRIDVQPDLENGHLRIPPLPQAWIDADPEFVAERHKIGEETDRHLKLSKTPGDGPVHIGGNGHKPTVAAPPKPPVFIVPDDAPTQRVQAELSRKLAECKALIAAMEQRTGLRLMLTRDLRVTVVL